MALYDAYLDESYDDVAPVFVVGGYLVRSDQAKLMDQEWKEMLDDADVPFFHMVDVAPCQGIYKRLGDDGCDRLARRAIAIIKKYITVGFCAAVNPDLIDNRGGANSYVLCLGECVVALSSWLLANDRESKVAVFFEEGHEYGAMAHRVIKGDIEAKRTPHLREMSNYFAGITYGKKEELRITQAADLLVWLTRRHIIDRITGERLPRRDFLSLVMKNHAISYLISNDIKLYTTIDGRAYYGVVDYLPYRPNLLVQQFIRRVFAKSPVIESAPHSSSYWMKEISE